MIVLCLSSCLVLPTTGCSFDSLDKPVRLYLADGDHTVLEPVPWEDEYRVVVRPEAGQVRPWTPTRVRVHEGDRLGFRQSGGLLTALVGAEEVELGSPPPGTRYVAWATRERRMGLTRNPLEAPLIFVGQAAAVVGGVVTLAGVLVLKDALDSDDDDEHR
jgi:hypothetical protein